MVRSLYAGVTGMRAHQTRMDTIGNNIANVNTYGFKSSRATFRDVYYQSLRGAAGGTATKGGLNPSQIGYGSTIGSVDIQQTQSIMSSTGNPLDLAIGGEGFFQVQDNAGNVYYTKAGILDIDANGNLVDSNGSFVLGTNGSPIGQAPGSNKIQFNIPSVPAKTASGEQSINGIKFTVTASNETTEGNVNLSLVGSSALPIGQLAKAVVANGNITVTINNKEKFASLGDLQSAVNEAIKEANGGKDHPAGQFIFQMDPSTAFDGGGLTGAEITGTDYAVKKGTVPMPTLMQNYFSIKSVGDTFAETGEPTYKITAAGVGQYEISIEVAGGKTYTASLSSAQMKSAGEVILTTAGGAKGDTITLGFPSESSMLSGMANKWAVGETVPDPAGGAGKTLTATDPEVGQPKYSLDATTQERIYEFNAAGWASTDVCTASEPSKELGLSSNSFKLRLGTAGGPQTIKDLTGVSIGADGVVRATHPAFEDPLEIGRIDLATFDNPAGLVQSGNTYFAASANSGEASLSAPGSNGTGPLASSYLESSNVDLSKEFADMITTQRGFQANSRMITVSDTMLEELINLKR